MEFERAVRETRGLGDDAYQPGMQALPRNDRAKVDCRNPALLTGSVFVDEALRHAQPNAPRWDYAVGVMDGRTEKIVWVEVHPATTHGVTEVLRKLAWLRQWLAGDGLPLARLPARHAWVASDRICIPRGSPQYKRAATAGLLPKRRLEL